MQAVSDFFPLAYAQEYISHDAPISHNTLLYRNPFKRVASYNQTKVFDILYVLSFSSFLNVARKEIKLLLKFEI